MYKKVENGTILTENDWDEKVLKSDAPILVYFYSTWCEYCRIMGPIVFELSQHYDGKLKIMGLCVEESPNIAIRYRIIHVPTFIFFKNGKAICKTKGANSKEYFIQRCNKVLKLDKALKEVKLTKSKHNYEF
jgi:thioredoxin 1